MKDKVKQKRKPRLTHILSDDEIEKNVSKLKGVTQKEKEITLAFSKRLNKLLEESDISQGAFATLIGGSPAAVSKYRGGKGVPKSSVLARICLTLDVSADYLLGISDLKSKNNEDKIVHQVTGLTDDAIKVLKDHKLEAKLSPFSSPRMAAINYLIGQDLEHPQLEDSNFKLLSDIADYLSIRADVKNSHTITYEGIVKYKDSDNSLIRAISTKALAFDDEIIDAILIDRIKFKLKELKKDYQNKYNKEIK